MQRTFLAGLMLGFAFSSLASAQETETLLLTVEPYRPPSGLTAAELTVGLGTLGRATSGTPLDGHGYDGSQGPAVDVATRFLFGKNRYLRFGFSARGMHQRGRGFGREGFGFASTVVDLTITARTMFPCMSNDARKVWFALSLGPSGGWHDAGRGRGDMATDDQGARLEAARTLDHVGLGWVVGVDLGLQFGAFLVDLAVDVRQHFGVDTVVASHFLPSAVLRAGWAFDASSH